MVFGVLKGRTLCSESVFQSAKICTQTQTVHGGVILLFRTKEDTIRGGLPSLAFISHIISPLFSPLAVPVGRPARILRAVLRGHMLGRQDGVRVQPRHPLAGGAQRGVLCSGEPVLHVPHAWMVGIAVISFIFILPCILKAY